MAVSRRHGAVPLISLLVAVIMVANLFTSGSAYTPSLCSSRPEKFVIYSQSNVGNTTAASTRVITDSPLGYLVVQAEPATFGPSRQSRRVGTTYGTHTQLTGGAGSDYITFTFDFHIKGKIVLNGKLVDVDGTIITLGAVSATASQSTVAVLGGTGDFLGARGSLFGTTVEANSDFSIATYKQEFTVWCDRPDQL